MFGWMVAGVLAFAVVAVAAWAVKAKAPPPATTQDSDAAARQKLIAKIRSMQKEAEQPVVVGLEEYFTGNNDLGSIAANLVPHPGIQRMYDVFRSIRGRDDVQGVYVQVEVEGDAMWPHALCVYVLTKMPDADLARLLEPLRPDPLSDSYWGDAKPVGLPDAAAGNRVVCVWWD